MKLVRFGSAGQEQPGLIDSDGAVRDLSGVVDDLTPETLGIEQLQRLKDIDSQSLPLAPAGVRMGPCVAKPGKFVCIGLNYHDHAVETGLTPPSEPVVFMKAVSAIGGPHDDILLMRGSCKSDWEVELGVVIGRRSQYIAPDQAMDVVAGFCLINDLSEREWQIERGGNWSKGKSADGYGPVGPWLVTPDEVADPQSLDLWLERNGEIMQKGSTVEMIFPVTELISYLSQCMSLNVGDIIATGTPAGVGLGRKPPNFLEDGDVLRLGITGLGEQSYQVFADKGL